MLFFGAWVYHVFTVTGKEKTTNLGFSQPTIVIRGSTDEGGNRPPCRWPRTFVLNMFHQSTHSKVMENQMNHLPKSNGEGFQSMVLPPVFLQIIHIIFGFSMKIHHPASLGIPHDDGNLQPGHCQRADVNPLSLRETTRA